MCKGNGLEAANYAFIRGIYLHSLTHVKMRGRAIVRSGWQHCCLFQAASQPQNLRFAPLLVQARPSVETRMWATTSDRDKAFVCKQCCCVWVCSIMLQCQYINADISWQIFCWKSGHHNSPASAAVVATLGKITSFQASADLIHHFDHCNTTVTPQEM